MTVIVAGHVDFDTTENISEMLHSVKPLIEGALSEKDAGLTRGQRIISHRAEYGFTKSGNRRTLWMTTSTPNGTETCWHH